MSGLIEHLEHFLGSIRGGGPAGQSVDGVTVAVVEYEPVFPGGPIHYSTLGLSKTHGRVGGNANDIAYELLMSCAVTGASSVMGSILAQLTRETLESTTPLAFGDVVGPRGLMFENSQMEAVYVRPPEHLPESFSRVVIEGGPVEFLWLAPITRAEAGFIGDHGSGDFEQLVKREGPRFADVYRRSLV